MIQFNSKNNTLSYSTIRLKVAIVSQCISKISSPNKDLQYLQLVV